MKIIYSKYTFEEVHNTRRSGYYWQASKEAAANYSSFGSSNHSTQLGAVYGSSDALYVSSNGNVYCDSQYLDLVAAPAFNLDLSKVEVVENQIVKIRLER